VPLAKWSEKTAVENQKDVLAAFKSGQLDSLTFEIGQGEIGGFLV
jgi:hypothetical protein